MGNGRTGEAKRKGRGKVAIVWEGEEGKGRGEQLGRDEKGK